MLRQALGALRSLRTAPVFRGSSWGGETAARAVTAAVGVASVSAAVLLAPAAHATAGPSAASVQASVQALTQKVKELEETLEASSSGEAELMAIGPLDGRYRSRVSDLQDYFSEFALIKYRVMMEVEYFIELCGVVPQLSGVPASRHEALRNIYRDFSLADAKEVKATEKITNHDVKAVEYFLKKQVLSANPCRIESFDLLANTFRY